MASSFGQIPAWSALNTRSHEWLSNQINNFQIYNQPVRGKKPLNKIQNKTQKCDDTQRMDCDFTYPMCVNSYEGGTVDNEEILFPTQQLKEHLE